MCKFKYRFVCKFKCRFVCKFRCMSMHVMHVQVNIYVEVQV